MTTVGQASQPRWVMRAGGGAYDRGKPVKLNSGDGGGINPLHVLGKVFDTVVVKPGQVSYRAVSPIVLEAAQGLDQLLAGTSLPMSANARKNIAARQQQGIHGFSFMEMLRPGKDANGKTIMLMDDPSMKDNPRFVSGALDLGLRLATDPYTYLGGAGMVREGGRAAARVTAKDLLLELGGKGTGLSQERLAAAAKLFVKGKGAAIKDAEALAALKELGYTGELRMTLGAPWSHSGLAIPGTGKLAGAIDAAVQVPRAAVLGKIAEDGRFARFAAPRNRALIQAALETNATGDIIPLSKALSNDNVRGAVQNALSRHLDAFNNEHIGRFLEGEGVQQGADGRKYMSSIRRTLRAQPDRGAAEAIDAIKNGTRKTPFQRLVGEMVEGIRQVGEDPIVPRDFIQDILYGTKKVATDGETVSITPGLVEELDSFGKKVSGRIIRKGSNDAMAIMESKIGQALKAQGTSHGIAYFIEHNPVMANLLERSKVQSMFDTAFQSYGEDAKFLAARHGIDPEKFSEMWGPATRPGKPSVVEAVDRPVMGGIANAPAEGPATPLERFFKADKESHWVSPETRSSGLVGASDANPLQRAIEPPVPEGHVRLYRGGARYAEDKGLPAWMAENLAADPAADARSRWFTPSRSEAMSYTTLDGADGVAKLEYVDVPESVYRANINTDSARAAENYGLEVLLPREWADRRIPLTTPGVSEGKPVASPQSLIGYDVAPPAEATPRLVRRTADPDVAFYEGGKPWAKKGHLIYVQESATGKAADRRGYLAIVTSATKDGTPKTIVPFEPRLKPGWQDLPNTIKDRWTLEAGASRKFTGDAFGRIPWTAPELGGFGDPERMARMIWDNSEGWLPTRFMRDDADRTIRRALGLDMPEGASRTGVTRLTNEAPAPGLGMVDKPNPLDQVLPAADPSNPLAPRESVLNRIVKPGVDTTPAQVQTGTERVFQAGPPTPEETYQFGLKAPKKGSSRIAKDLREEAGRTYAESSRLGDVGDHLVKSKGGRKEMRHALAEAIGYNPKAAAVTEEQWAQREVFRFSRQWQSALEAGKDPFKGVDGDTMFAAWYKTLQRKDLIQLGELGYMPRKDWEFISHLVNGNKTTAELTASRFSAITKMWRAMAIARPGFSNRNFWGILSDNAAFGTGIKSYRKAGVLWNEYKAAAAEFRSTGSREALEAFAAKRGRNVLDAIEGFGQTVGQGLEHADLYEASRVVRGADKLQQFWEKSKYNPFKLNAYVSGVWSDLPVEVNGRLALYLHLTENEGMTHVGALGVVDHIHRDYLNQSGFDIAAKSLYPFWMFRSRNLISQAEMFARNRGLGRFMLSQMILQKQKTAGDEFPPFLQGFQWPTGGGTVLAGSAFPAGDAVSKVQSFQGAMRGDLDPWRDLAIDDLGPVFKSSLALATNKDPFTGKPVQSNGSVSQLLDYVARSYLPFMDMPRQIRRSNESSNPLGALLEGTGMTSITKRDYGQ